MRKIKGSILVLIMISVLICISGCAEEDYGKLIEESTKRFKEISSVRTKVNVDVLLESFIETSGISMDINLENTKEPLIGHAEGMTRLERRGEYVIGEMEVYQSTKDDITTSYSRLNDTWTVETAPYDKDHSGIKPEYIDEKGKVANFSLSKESVMCNDKECYELYGEMKGCEIKNLFDLNTLSLVSNVNIPDEESIEKLEVPVIINIYKENLLPAKIFIDMTDVLNEEYKKMDEEVTVGKFTIRMEYYDFDKVESIEIPEEAVKWKM